MAVILSFRGERPVHLVILVFALLTLWPSAASAASSIFDDSWKPATRPATAIAPKPTAPNPEIKKPDRPIADPIPSVAPVIVNPANLRAPIPDSAELIRTRKLFRELFEKELANREIQSRRVLARKLLDEGVKCPDKSTDKYVLFAAARQAALDGHDLELCFSAIDALAAAFDVDGPAIKAQAATTGVRGDSLPATWDNCRLAMPVIDELVAQENFAAAAKLSASLQQASEGDPFFKLVLPRKTRQLEAMLTEHAKIAGDIEKLKTTPGDAAAAGAVGAFDCFLKGDWEEGLPLLAKGSDANTKNLAAAELAGATDSDALQKLAEAWSAVAAKQPEAYRAQTRIHAAALYQKAAAGSTGLRLKAFQVAIDKLQQAIGPTWVDLSSKVDAQKDRVSGKWTRAGSEIRVNNESSRLEPPYQPPEEYTFRIDFTPISGEGTAYLGLAKNGKSFQFITGNWQNTSAGFQPIDGLSTNESRSAFKQRNEIGRRRVIIVEVRNDRLKAFIDGQIVKDWPTDYHEFTPTKQHFVPSDLLRLGIGAYATPTTFHRIEVLEYSGSGKWLR